jgi:hypothetical protein
MAMPSQDAWIRLRLIPTLVVAVSSVCSTKIRSRTDKCSKCQVAGTRGIMNEPLQTPALKLLRPETQIRGIPKTQRSGITLPSGHVAIGSLTGKCTYTTEISFRSSQGGTGAPFSAKLYASGVRQSLQTHHNVSGCWSISRICLQALLDEIPHLLRALLWDFGLQTTTCLERLSRDPIGALGCPSDTTWLLYCCMTYSHMPRCLRSPKSKLVSEFGGLGLSMPGPNLAEVSSQRHLSGDDLPQKNSISAQSGKMSDLSA